MKQRRQNNITNSNNNQVTNNSNNAVTNNLTTNITNKIHIHIHTPDTDKHGKNKVRKYRNLL